MIGRGPRAAETVADAYFCARDIRIGLFGVGEERKPGRGDRKTLLERRGELVAEDEARFLQEAGAAREQSACESRGRRDDGARDANALFHP